MTSISISTTIPTFIENNFQMELLRSALNSLANQTKAPHEVIISDNTRDLLFLAKIREVTKDFSKLNIHYFLNHTVFGIAANTNFAESHSTGEVIHILHQDDFILNKKLYEEVEKYFLLNKKTWIIAQGKVGDRILESKFDKTTKFGFNELGGPSSLFVLKTKYKPFNNRYNMLVDVINYHEYYLELGMPLIIRGANIEFNIHDFQYSKNYSSKKVKLELINFIDEYNIESEEIIDTITTIKREIHQQKLLIYAAYKNNKLNKAQLIKYISVNFLKSIKRRIFN
jgi:hypothetical protein